MPDRRRPGRPLRYSEPEEADIEDAVHEFSFRLNRLIEAAELAGCEVSQYKPLASLAMALKDPEAERMGDIMRRLLRSRK